MSFKGNAITNKVLRGRINKLETLCVTAYEIALKNGFEGTEAEWLASLKGAPGATGALWVTVEHKGDGTYRTTKTHAEILAAHQAGGVVYCDFGNLFPLVHATSDVCVFGMALYNGEYYRIFIDSSDEVRILITEIKGDSGGTGGLTITDDGEGNVVITSTGSVSITDDGEGNVTIG